jgi:hypothetical protein
LRTFRFQPIAGRRLASTQTFDVGVGVVDDFRRFDVVVR